MTSSPRYDVDAIATVQEYLDRSDWRVNANRGIRSAVLS